MIDRIKCLRTVHDVTNQLSNSYGYSCYPSQPPIEEFCSVEILQGITQMGVMDEGKMWRNSDLNRIEMWDGHRLSVIELRCTWWVKDNT